MPATKDTKKKSSNKKKQKNAAKKHGGKMSAGRKARRRAAKAKAKAPRYTAATADKYELYELAVQSPEVDVEFLYTTYQAERGRKPKHFREDFCGTAAMCAEWVKLGDDMTAEGYDLDPEPLDWGRDHHLARIGDAAERVDLKLADVREPAERPADVRCAQNFSYQIFKTREELKEYFTKAYEGLAKDGIFVIDLYGGPEALEEMEEEREVEEGFTYVWDQDKYFPGTGEFQCFIHFLFEDGSKMRKAFSYTWRTWHLTELRDLLYEVGFKQVDSYFEGEDPDPDEDGGNGVFEKDQKGESCPAWVAYLVSHR